MKKLKILSLLAFIGTIVILGSSCKKEEESIPSSVKDIDGNVYNTITIGSQVWMVENLKVSRYRNGDSIPNIADSTDWGNLTSGAYCEYNNAPEIGVSFGKLYNWYAATDNRNIAPKGWHLPSDKEWTIMINHLGGESVAGDKLKEIDSDHWIVATANNESGFTALPGGNRNTNGSFDDAGEAGYWWSSTENTTTNAYGRGMYFFYGGVARGYRDKVVGFSVRCLMD